MKATEKLESQLRDFALRYPEATEDFPWGERAIKVRGKAFVFMRSADDEVSIAVSVEIPCEGGGDSGPQIMRAGGK